MVLLVCLNIMLVGMLIVWIMIHERSELHYDWTTSNGAVATLLNEAQPSLLIDDDWALAKEEEINYRVVDEAVNNDDSNDDDDDIKY